MLDYEQTQGCAGNSEEAQHFISIFWYHEQTQGQAMAKKLNTFFLGITSKCNSVQAMAKKLNTTRLQLGIFDASTYTFWKAEEYLSTLLCLYML